MADVVHQPVVELHVRVAGGDLAACFEEQPVGGAHDRRLVHGGHAPAPVGARVLERAPARPALPPVRDSGFREMPVSGGSSIPRVSRHEPAQRGGGVVVAVVLDPRIEVLVFMRTTTTSVCRERRGDPG